MALGPGVPVRAGDTSLVVLPCSTAVGWCHQFRHNGAEPPRPPRGTGAAHPLPVVHPASGAHARQRGPCRGVASRGPHLTSPRGGAEYAYVSENTERFIGLSEDEGQEIKEGILARILHASNVYSHEWRMGDFVVYDNAQVVHRRELFEGNRWIKGTKIFAPAEYFAIPAGEVVEAPAEARDAPAPA
ncbi:hypothetical protein C1N81_05835 [Streptomyces sp. SGAir0957]